MSFVFHISFLTIASIRVLVLPMWSNPSGEGLARQTTELMRQVASEIDGLESITENELEKGMEGEAAKIFRRCGKELDCRLKIGKLLSAQLVISGSVEAMGASTFVNLQMLDVGSSVVKSKISRTLMGSKIGQMASLESMLTLMIFPDRMVGQLEITFNPPGGEVWLDGQRQVEKAPATLRLDHIKEGQHTVRVTRQGYSDFFAVVQVPFMGVSRLDVNMHPQH